MEYKQLERLRDGDKIKGYVRVEQNAQYFSKDLLWWIGKPIHHTARDQYSGYKDINNKPLFEEDIITFRRPGFFRPAKHYAIVFKNDNWYLSEWDSGKLLPLSLLDTSKALRFVSYSFINA